jgi:hypothetical protein
LTPKKLYTFKLFSDRKLRTGLASKLEWRRAATTTSKRYYECGPESV